MEFEERLLRIQGEDE